MKSLIGITVEGDTLIFSDRSIKVTKDEVDNFAEHLLAKRTKLPEPLTDDEYRATESVRKQVEKKWRADKQYLETEEEQIACEHVYIAELGGYHVYAAKYFPAVLQLTFTGEKTFSCNVAQFKTGEVEDTIRQFVGRLAKITEGE